MNKVLYYVAALKSGRMLTANIPLFVAIFLYRADIVSIPKTILLLCSFILLYSGVYVMNDLFDYESDRRNPKKKDRIIASGKISRTEAAVLAVLVMVPTYIYIAITSVSLAKIVVILLAINVLYSALVKKFAYYDLVLVSWTQTIKFLVGILICGAVLPTTSSFWAIIGMIYFLYIAMHSKKQRAESYWGIEKNFLFGQYSIKGLQNLSKISIFLAGVCLGPAWGNQFFFLALLAFIVIAGVSFFVSDTGAATVVDHVEKNRIVK